jgi:hypothetical protein
MRTNYRHVNPLTRVTKKKNYGKKIIKYMFLTLLLMFVSCQLLLIILKVMKLIELPWITPWWELQNVTTHSGTVIVQGYGLCTLMICTYGGLLLLSSTVCLCINRGGYCCVLHCKNQKIKELDNHELNIVQFSRK